MEGSVLSVLSIDYFDYCSVGEILKYSICFDLHILSGSSELHCAVHCGPHSTRCRGKSANSPRYLSVSINFGSIVILKDNFSI